MKPIAIVAAGAVLPQGEGARAFSVGELGGRPETRIARDPVLEAAGLKRPHAARVLSALPERVDRAEALLARALELLFLDLDARAPGWRRPGSSRCWG